MKNNKFDQLYNRTLGIFGFIIALYTLSLSFIEEIFWVSIVVQVVFPITLLLFLLYQYYKTKPKQPFRLVFLYFLLLLMVLVVLVKFDIVSI